MGPNGEALSVLVVRVELLGVPPNGCAVAVTCGIHVPSMGLLATWLVNIKSHAQP